MIVFSGSEFIFRFLSVFLIVYYLTPAQHRDITLLLGSIFLYATVDIRYLILLLALVGINYALGEKIWAERSGDDKRGMRKDEAPSAGEQENTQMEQVRDLLRRGLRSGEDPSENVSHAASEPAPVLSSDAHEDAPGDVTGEIEFHDIFAEEDEREREKEAFARAQARLKESYVEKERKAPKEKDASRGNEKLSLTAKSALILAIIIDVSALILCKYLALNVQSFILPLGMSFYIFKMISYQADLYRGTIKHRPGFVRTAAAAFAAQLDPTLDELGDIKTAVSEAVTNAIVHAYPDALGKISLRAGIYDGSVLEIVVRDWGCGIPDVEKAREPLYTTGGEERSGMGFTIMESFMDALIVRSKPGKGTVVTMKRRIAQRAGRK